MCSRLALAIEWDHVSQTKTKQKTSRELSPSPSPHPQRSSFNPLYEDLTASALSSGTPHFLCDPDQIQAKHTLPPWKPESYQGSKVFEHWLEATSGKPHIRAYVPWHGGIENYTKWHQSGMCEVQVKRKFLCSDLGSVPSHSMLCIQILQHPERIWNSKHIWSQAFEIRDTQSVLQDLLHHVVFDSCRGLWVACCKSWNLVMEECFRAHPPFLPTRAVLWLAAGSLSKLSFSVAVPICLFCDR